MKRWPVGAALVVALLGQVRADAQNRFGDPLILVGPGASIGVRVRDLTSDDRRKATLESVEGVFVESVVAGMDAEKAGIKGGDVIVEFDGERVRSVRGFGRLVSETPPQRTVKAVLVRDGSRRTVDVTPELQRLADGGLRIDPALPLLNPQGNRRLLPQLPQGQPRFRGFIGVMLEAITGQMADYFGVSAGVLVSAVDLDSPADRAGLKAGDLMTALDGQAVTRPADVSEAVRRARPSSKLEVKVVRDHKEMTIAITVPLVMPMLLSGERIQ